METFLINSYKDDKNNVLPIHDFGYAVIDAINYNNWYYNEKIYDYELLVGNAFTSCYLKDDIIPVGSVEYVISFMENVAKHNNKKFVIPKPINVPDVLVNFAKRFIVTLGRNSIDVKNVFKYCEEVFIKDANVIKGYSGFHNKQEDIPDGMFFVSEVVEIKSEWRCFVYNNELLDLRCYSGEFENFPDIKEINKMINCYKDFGYPPPAYTLDVGINKDDETFIIECHNFFSCGLYGFNNHSKLLNMLIKSFKYELNKMN